MRLSRRFLEMFRPRRSSRARAIREHQQQLELMKPMPPIDAKDRHNAPRASGTGGSAGAAIGRVRAVPVPSTEALAEKMNPRDRAVWEWNHRPELRRVFTSGENYVSWRTAHLQRQFQEKTSHASRRFKFSPEGKLVEL